MSEDCCMLQAGATEVATWLRAQAAHLGPFLSTVLLLMAELARKEASPLRPWLSALPDSHNCVLAWTPDERAALQGGRRLHLADHRDWLRSAVRLHVPQRVHVPAYGVVHAAILLLILQAQRSVVRMQATHKCMRRRCCRSCGSSRSGGLRPTGKKVNLHTSPR